MKFLLPFVLIPVKFLYPVFGLYLATEVANHYGYDSLLWYAIAWIAMFVIGLHPVGVLAIVCYFTYFLYSTLNYGIAISIAFFAVGLLLTALGILEKRK